MVPKQTAKHRAENEENTELRMKKTALRILGEDKNTRNRPLLMLSTARLIFSCFSVAAVPFCQGTRALLLVYRREYQDGERNNRHAAWSSIKTTVTIVWSSPLYTAIVFVATVLVHRWVQGNEKIWPWTNGMAARLRNKVQHNSLLFSGKGRARLLSLLII